mgnify:CR=1 FL=1
MANKTAQDGNARGGNGGGKSRRGFAAMNPERQREIASEGGRAAHAKGTAHEWTSEEARVAGRKGGQISRGGRGRLSDETSAIDGSPEPTEPSGAFGTRQIEQ